MTLSTLDWSIIICFLVLFAFIGVYVSKQAGTDSKSFFLSGRNMPWWLLGVSMVATTFAADTPGLVTQLVRENGVSGNWVWWAMLLTGMLTVFFYAKLWRKSGITTDLEFYELRYSGKIAGYLRGFRAIYLGVIFNVITMAGVCLAGAKIANILLGIDQSEMLIYSSIIVVFYSAFGGLKGVLLTDFIQFIIAMIGSVWATIYIINLPEIGGVETLINHHNVVDSISFFPDFSNKKTLITLLIIPLAVQWWSTWYPGAEPGGGGYIAQRMLASKDEKHATWATLFFNITHYAIRPWPWILIGLTSLLLFPTTINSEFEKAIPKESILLLNNKVKDIDIKNLIKKADSLRLEDSNEIDITFLNKVKENKELYQIKSLAYIYKAKSSNYSNKKTDPRELESLVTLQLENPNIPIDKLGGDLAYATLMKRLPSGLLGIVLLSLIAAFMSTISTQLNWGSSYIVNDFYKRFIKPDSTDKEDVLVGRISTVVLMLCAALFSFFLQSAGEVLNLLLQIGAGTGLLFILRWFWHRVNPYSEIAAMVISFVIAIFFFVNGKLETPLIELAGHWQLVTGVVITTIGWIVTTLLTQPSNKETLDSFNLLIFGNESKFKGFGAKTVCFLAGVFGVYSLLFSIGSFVFGDYNYGFILLAVASILGFIIYKFQKDI